MGYLRFVPESRLAGSRKATLGTHSHVLPGLQGAAAEALDTILAEPAAAEARQQSVSEGPSPARSWQVEGSFRA